MDARTWFEGRRLIISTKHGKEQVLAPLLEQALGVVCFTDPQLDTDVLGTFSGEVPRHLDPLETARRKCQLAMDAHDCDLALASEGSFGPHPGMFFIAANEELLLLKDARHQFEIAAKVLSTETNFGGGKVESEEELIGFAEKAGFPDHALILRPTRALFADMVKGIHDASALMSVFGDLMAMHGSCYVETDMRAMYNPSRMRVIGEAAQQLLLRIESCCPGCQRPGFGEVKAISGLPCSYCGQPTRSTLAMLRGCVSCSYTEEQRYPRGKKQEDPTYCDYCNP